MWQDYVLPVGAFMFSIALIPTLRSKTQKPALWTSIGTVLVLIVFAVTFATLDLWVSAIAEAIGVLFWSALAIQVIRSKNR